MEDRYLADDIDRRSDRELRDRLRHDLTLAELERNEARIAETDVEGILAFAHHVHGERNGALDERVGRRSKGFAGRAVSNWACLDGAGFGTATTCLAFNQLPACSGVEIPAFSAESDLSSGANVLFRSSLPRALVGRLRFSCAPSKTSGDIAVSEGLRLALVYLAQ